MSTAVSSAITNFMFRRNAERVDTEEPEEEERNNNENNSITEEEEFYDEEGQFVGENNTNNNYNSSSSSRNATTTLESLPEDVETGGRTTNNNNNNNNNTNNSRSSSSSVTTPLTESSTESTESSSSSSSSSESSRPTTNTATITTSTIGGMTLRDLEEERIAAQRRAGSCVLLSSFFLFQLWIQALTSGDFGLLLLCLVFTSWTARFVRYTREQEEELSRRINNWDENVAAVANEGEGTSAFDDARRMRRMSFQSQLALAIIQSQIQLMEGGYGHPDGNHNSNPGLSDEAKQNWDLFTYDGKPTSLKERGLFNDTAKSVGVGSEEMAAPECTICLCEYEKGDKLVSLPCKHVFHEECVTSWTDHNKRCPLCNSDLEEMVAVPVSSSGSGDNIV